MVALGIHVMTRVEGVSSWSECHLLGDFCAVIGKWKERKAQDEIQKKQDGAEVPGNCRNLKSWRLGRLGPVVRQHVMV